MFKVQASNHIIRTRSTLQPSCRESPHFSPIRVFKKHPSNPRFHRFRHETTSLSTHNDRVPIYHHFDVPTEIRAFSESVTVNRAYNCLWIKPSATVAALLIAQTANTIRYYHQIKILHFATRTHESKVRYCAFRHVE